MRGTLILLLVTCLAQWLAGCTNSQHRKEEVALAMKKYDRLIKKMDVDSIALLYTTDGDLGKAAHGRDSIRKFLAGFRNIQVLSQLSTSDSLQIRSDTAYQSGRYYQRDVIGKDTVAVKGTYHTTWQWVPPNGWLIKRIETKSLQ